MKIVAVPVFVPVPSNLPLISKSFFSLFFFYRESSFYLVRNNYSAMNVPRTCSIIIKKGKVLDKLYQSMDVKKGHEIDEQRKIRRFSKSE